MRKIKTQYILASLAAVLTLFTACTEDNTITEKVQSAAQGNSDNESDEVIAALSGIAGIYDVELRKGDDGTPIYYFKFTQYIDNFDSSKGIYLQQAALLFKGFDKDVVVHTCGYALQTDKFGFDDLSIYLDANQIDIEHRYFGSSLPEDFENLTYTYLDASQQACDIHNLVSTLREKLFKNGKWVSTGTSKDGITTALQAFYSDIYGWDDIDVFVPFCAPFMTGTLYSDYTYSCNDKTPGVYLSNYCGSGYEEGSVENTAYQRLRLIPYYICTDPTIRDRAVKAVYQVEPAFYAKIMKQYNSHSYMSTGDVTKDLTALALNRFYEKLFVKFSYVPYSEWAKLVPDPALLASGNATEEDFQNFADFLTMDVNGLAEKLKENETRTIGERWWVILLQRRTNNTAPYYIQGYKELGLNDHDYSLVDGDYLTAEECDKVNYLFTGQAEYQGLYPQDKGLLMRSFLEWAKTESTRPIIFVYAHNDPWTGAGIPDETAAANPMIIKVVDRIATHNNYFLSRECYELTTEQTIVAALKKFLKR